MAPEDVRGVLRVSAPPALNDLVRRPHSHGLVLGQCHGASLHPGIRRSWLISPCRPVVHRFEQIHPLEVSLTVRGMDQALADQLVEPGRVHPGGKNLVLDICPGHHEVTTCGDVAVAAHPDPEPCMCARDTRLCPWEGSVLEVPVHVIISRYRIFDLLDDLVPTDLDPEEDHRTPRALSRCSPITARAVSLSPVHPSATAAS